MAIPEGYRLLTAEDVGKTFGVDLELEVYIDGSVTPIDSMFVNNTTINLTNFIYTTKTYDEFGYEAYVPQIFLNDDNIFQFNAWFDDINPSTMPSDLSVSSYNTDIEGWNNFFYVKDKSTTPTEDPKGIVSKSKMTAIFDKAREKTGTTNKYTLGDIPGIMDELEKVSVWEGTKEEINTSTGITEDKYNVLTNKNKVTFNTAQQKMENVLNVYFTIEVSTTSEMNAFLEESTAGRVFKYVGETDVFINGSYYKVNDTNDGYEEVVVLNLQEKTATPTKSEQEITPDSTHNGLSKVVVEPIPDNYIVPSGTVELTTLGEHDVTQYAKANVNVPASAFEDSIYGELNAMTFGEASGYTVTLEGDLVNGLGTYLSYQVNGGAVISAEGKTVPIVLEGVQNIVFSGGSISYGIKIGTTENGNDIGTSDGSLTYEPTSNITLYISWQAGGGSN